MGKFSTLNQHTVEPFIKSVEIPVYWAGWESTTTHLQNEGWQFSVIEEAYHFRYQLAMTHASMRLYAIFDPWQYERHYSSMSYGMNIPPLVVRQVSANMQVTRIHTTVDWSTAVHVNMVPEIRHESPRSMADLLPFSRMQPVQEITREVIVEKQADMSVIEHLERILVQQEEQQAELRAKRLDATKRGSIIELPKQRQVRFQVVS